MNLELQREVTRSLCDSDDMGLSLRCQPLETMGRKCAPAHICVDHSHSAQFTGLPLHCYMQEQNVLFDVHLKEAAVLSPYHYDNFRNKYNSLRHCVWMEPSL